MSLPIKQKLVKNSHLRNSISTSLGVFQLGTEADNQHKTLLISIKLRSVHIIITLLFASLGDLNDNKIYMYMVKNILKYHFRQTVFYT